MVNNGQHIWHVFKLSWGPSQTGDLWYWRIIVPCSSVAAAYVTITYYHYGLSFHSQTISHHLYSTSLYWCSLTPSLQQPGRAWHWQQRHRVLKIRQHVLSNRLNSAKQPKPVTHSKCLQMVVDLEPMETAQSIHNSFPICAFALAFRFRDSTGAKCVKM